VPHVREPTARHRQVSKGDHREAAILDAAEVQLARDGYEAITVARLAEAVGLARAGFYFYFTTKSDVVAALVERTVSALHRTLDELPNSDARPLEQLIWDLMQLTQTMWEEHGVVMRAAVDLAPSVRAIDTAWTAAINAVTNTAASVAALAGLADTPGPTGALDISTALVWMTERNFYQASRHDTSLAETAESCTAIWLRALGLAHNDRTRVKSTTP
jgi:TetR/AcrR family transcriptional regulator, ethionamide resistance regulator